MKTTFRPPLFGFIAAFALATGAAGISGLNQAAAGDLPAFACANSSGGTTGAATVSSIRAGHHLGFDRLVIEFATSNPVPQYEIQRQASSTFTRDPSGQALTLDGSGGIRIVLRNSDVAPGVPASQQPGLPEIQQIANIGNFERVVSYGVGLHEQACFRVFTLTNPSRLVIDVQTRQDASSSTQPTPSSAQSATDGTAVSGDLAMTGHPARAQVAALPLAFFLGLLALIGGIAVLTLTRFIRR